MPDQIMQKLNEMQARCDAATEGPWEHLNPRNTYNHAVVDSHGEDLANDYEGVWYFEEDAEFIASARTDMPRLIDALKAVLELHQPVPYAQGSDYCDECEHPAPCQTVQAIATALGADDE